MRYELSDHGWGIIKPRLPNKPRGVRRVDDRRVVNGIFWVLRSGAPWCDLSGSLGVRRMVDRLERRIKPTEAQRAKFDEFKAASNKAA